MALSLRSKKDTHTQPGKNKKKSKRLVKKVQSTQKNIPIKEFANGIIITNDDRYVKILEVIPSPFFLRTNEQQFNIYRSFYEMLRIAPVDIQFKCVSLPADVTSQIETLNKNELTETNEDVILFYEDYKNRLYESQQTGVRKRFFIVFNYERTKRKLFSSSGNNDIIDATNWLNTMAYRIANKMKECDNEVIFVDGSRMNDQNAEIFYTLLNREKCVEVPFAKRKEEVLKKYFDYYGSSNVFVPASDYVAPDTISYMDNNYLVVNETYYKFMCIPSDGYTSLLWPGWLNVFVGQQNGIDVDVFFKREESDVQGRLKRALGHAGADISGEATNTDGYETAASTYQSAYYLRQGMLNGQAMYHMSVIVTVSGKSPEEVNQKIDNIETACKERDIKIIEMKFQNEDAFQSVLPLCKLDKDIFEKTRRNVLTEGAAAFYIFTTFEMNHPKGIYIGDDQHTGSLVIIDYFNRKYMANPNVFIAGTSGAGKTYSLLLQAIRTRLAKIPIFIIAPEKENEFRRLCDALGGQFIQIAKGSSYRINPMEIFMKDQKALAEEQLIDGTTDTISYLTEKVETLLKFCQMFTDKLLFEERTILEGCILDTYEKFGITANNESLWNEDHTHFKRMPVFSDLKKSIDENPQATPRLKQLGKMLTAGNASCFNGETNIDTSNEFIVFGLEHNDKEMLPISIFLAMDFAWSKIKENRTKRKMLFIDEWWKMAFNPIAAEYSMEIAKTIRAYSGGVCFATQQMSDILAADEIGAAVLGNCDTKILMRMGRKDLDAVGQMIYLSEQEKNEIERFDPGNALLIAGNNRMMIRFVASANEDMLCATDEKTLKKYADAKKRRLDFEKLQEEMLAAKDIDDMLDDVTTDDPSAQSVTDGLDDSMFVSVYENMTDDNIFQDVGK